MLTRIVVATAASLVVLSGCSSSEAPRALSDPEDTVSSIDLTAATELKLVDDLPVVATLPTKHGARDVYFRGFADDNTLTGTMGLPEPPPEGIPSAVESRSYPFLYDLKSKTFTVLDESSRRVTPYVADIAATADSVVWVEGHGTIIGTSDFEIRAFDRQTGTVTKLGRFVDTSDQVLYDDDLLIHDGVAYFSTRALARKKDKQSAVHTVPVDGSQALKVLVPDADAIQLDGNSLSYDQRDVRQSLDLSTGVSTPAPVSPLAADPGFCGAGKTNATEYWCLGRHADSLNETDVDDPVLTFEDAAGHTTTIATPAGGQDLNYPVPRDVLDYGDWIGVTVSGGSWPAPQYLLDLVGKTSRIMPQDMMLTEASPGGTLALLSEVIGKGGAPQRVVKLPTA